MRRLAVTKRLAPGHVLRIQFAAVQVMALYGTEIWWNGQNDWCEEYQKFINRQGRAVTGMFRLAPTGIVTWEAELWPALSLLNNRERQ